MIQTLFEPGEIRRRRRGLGLSQQRLAELSGLSIRTIVRLELGENKRGGTAYTLNCILKALEVAENALSGENPIKEDGDVR
jgi:transcriptional regulator with XRE-family HTH domain